MRSQAAELGNEVNRGLFRKDGEGSFGNREWT